MAPEVMGHHLMLLPKMLRQHHPNILAGFYMTTVRARTCLELRGWDLHERAYHAQSLRVSAFRVLYGGFRVDGIGHDLTKSQTRSGHHEFLRY